MLASITPLGERGRGSRWLVTVAAFALGATAAGALAGAAAGAVGAATVARLTGGDGRMAMLAAGLVAALMLDLRRRPVPGPRRQVNERWLDEFRGWVYGVGFGFQLGLGLATVVTSAATYAAVLAAVLSNSAAAGALILGLHGAIRGLTPLAGARVRRPDQLVALHRSLERWRLPVSRGGAVKLEAHGLRLELPHHWSGRIFSRSPGTATLHAANYPLALSDGEFGDRSTARMAAGAMFLALTEYVAGAGLEPGRGLFAAQRLQLPLDAAAFSSRGLAHPRPGQTGMQQFFTAAGRPLCLYVVLAGGRGTRRRQLAEVGHVLRSLRVSHRIR